MCEIQFYTENFMSKSLRLLSKDTFEKIENGDMGNFVNYWGYYGLSFYILIDIELYITENMYF